MTRPVIEGHDVAFFDLDGVIYLGPAAVEGAPEGVATLRERGVRTIFVTNNAARPAQTVVDQLTRLGFPSTLDDVITSAQAAAGYLRRELEPGAKILVAGTQNLVDEITGAGFTAVTGAKDDPVAVIQGYDPEMTWPRLDEAGYAVQGGARWFATNTDSTRPTDRGLVPGAGAAVDAVGATVKVRPTIIGKPYAPLMEEAVRRTGATNPIFVGDRLDTDIAGAVGVGMESFLVFTGAHGKQDLVEAVEAQRPTSIGLDVRSLLEPRREARVEGRRATCREVVVEADDRGVASVQGDLGGPEEQLDAVWALAQLTWAGIVTDPAPVLEKLDRIR
ncbi:HAD-IIA family hydrolase [Nigerium massiliense]|uniref:HAD-IIA family hydrolase n=1 Tax=Nigerium massiliense TaxID=1522317 RepID=UPI00058AC8D2|nr:HAD-IIA family hydrolase [Nigerium massiliense]